VLESLSLSFSFCLVPFLSFQQQTHSLTFKTHTHKHTTLQIRFLIQDRSKDMDGSIAAHDNYERDEFGIFDSLERLLWYGIFPRSTVVVNTNNCRVAIRNSADVAIAYGSLVPLLESGAIVSEICVRLLAVRECVGGGVFNNVIEKSCLERCNAILYELSTLAYAHPFLEPVDIDSIPGYADVISSPMDLSTVQDRLASGFYLKNKNDSNTTTAYERCYQDVELIWKNCLKFNDPDSEIANAARELREFFRVRYENSISIPMQMYADRHIMEDSVLSKRELVDVEARISLSLFLYLFISPQSHTHTQSHIQSQAHSNFKKLRFT